MSAQMRPENAHKCPYLMQEQLGHKTTPKTTPKAGERTQGAFTRFNFHFAELNYK